MIIYLYSPRDRLNWMSKESLVIRIDITWARLAWWWSYRSVLVTITKPSSFLSLLSGVNLIAQAISGEHYFTTPSVRTTFYDFEVVHRNNFGVACVCEGCAHNLLMCHTSFSGCNAHNSYFDHVHVQQHRKVRAKLKLDHTSTTKITNFVNLVAKVSKHPSRKDNHKLSCQ